MVLAARHFRMMRDVRDVIVSWTYLNFANNDDSQFNNMPEMMNKLQWFKSDPNYFSNHPLELLDYEPWVRKVCRQWKFRITRDDEFIQRTETGEVDARVMSIRYEDLHRDTPAVRNSMYEFLDLDPDLAEPLDSGRHKTSAGHANEDPTRMYRKGAVGDWKNYFTDSTSAWVNEMVGPLLRNHGWT